MHVVPASAPVYDAFFVSMFAQTFLLKVTKRNTDGTTTITKTVPCDDGSSAHTCVVEVRPLELLVAAAVAAIARGYF